MEDTSIWHGVLKILHRELKEDFSNTISDEFLRSVYHRRCLSSASEKRRPSEGSCFANAQYSFSREHPRKEMAQKVSLPFPAPGAVKGRARILVPGKEGVAAGGPSFQGQHVPFLQLGQLQRRQ